MNFFFGQAPLLLFAYLHKAPTALLFIRFSTGSSHVYHPAFTPLHPFILFSQLALKPHSAAPAEPKISVYSVTYQCHATEQGAGAAPVEKPAPGAAHPHTTPGTSFLPAHATSPKRPGAAGFFFGEGRCDWCAVPPPPLKARSRGKCPRSVPEPRNPGHAVPAALPPAPAARPARPLPVPGEERAWGGLRQRGLSAVTPKTPRLALSVAFGRCDLSESFVLRCPRCQRFRAVLFHSVSLTWVPLTSLSSH